MTEKELRKLNRYQLLELLIMQTERADQLEAKVKLAEKQLVDQMLQITPLGSIAEVSLQVEGVFQAAQKAADMYIDAAKKKAEEIEAEARKQSAEILAQAMEEARRIKGE
ncbi:MAG: DNA repair protein [Ruminococcaceae bacterium]|nr:DNA repair protein [Oscillospiraceae bacterium]